VVGDRGLRHPELRGDHGLGVALAEQVINQGSLPGGRQRSPNARGRELASLDS
jgi:hypothetical protein